jgi:hypothetical protein
MNRQPQKNTAQKQRAREQQAVLNKLRGGGVISGAQPANPIIGAIQSFIGGAGKGAIPALGAARLGGQEVLMNRGGWDTRRAGSGSINVGGQTWYPAQRGQDLVYKRAPGLVGGQYGSIFSGRGTEPPAPDLPPPLGNRSAAELAYQQEVSRVAQLTAQDPELQRYEEARQKAKLAGPGSAAEQSAEDLGMQIWAKKYGKPGDLASRVKPGQAGYDVIQRTLGAGQMGSPLNLPFDTSSPLGTTPPISPASYDAGKVAQGLGLSTVPRNAFAGASAAPYAGFSQGPTLQSAPLGFPSEMPTASYAGATGIQPMGSAVDKFDPKGLEAQRLLEMFKDSIFTTQK